ncbi:MAG TPA: excinuclease ABC subunit UvrA [Actinomycetota bacterium]|nr:excinuclease ABC subunit UvrA [Actinomycetota bacterium]
MPRRTALAASEDRRSTSAGASDRLIVRGAREHNLKNVSLDLPRNALIVFTGISGSGKSSLAFDTIYAEGQRRYVESLSSYARQFLGQMDKPEVDFIEGLSPAISIDQKSASRNPRSTVGTITEIYDYMRLLFARIGRPHCHNCGRPIARQTPEQIVDQVLDLPEGTRFQVLAPIVRGRKGEFTSLFEDLARRGYARARVDGEVKDLSEKIRLDRYFQHDIDVVVDRLVIKEGIQSRLTDSVETALKLAEGTAAIELVDDDKAGGHGSAGGGRDNSGGRTPEQTRESGTTSSQRTYDSQDIIFSEAFACTFCGLSFDELAPRNFSFNSPYGACERCDGLGTRLEVDPDLVIPNPDLSIDEGAIAPWSGRTLEYFERLLESAAKAFKFKTNVPFKKLPKRAQDIILFGSDDQELHVRYRNRFNRVRAYWTVFEGVIPWLERRRSETDSDYARERYEQFFREVPCPACHGARLRPESLAVTVAGRNIHEVCDLPIGEVDAFMREVELSDREAAIAERVLKEIHARLGFLLDVGLDYLSLARGAATLAGGEAQRIRLATQIGSGLVGVLYILDEPSIGLHQRDNRRLIDTLVRLRDLGNTLIVVEHDEDTIRTADHIVDIGPGAGEFGGEVVYSGSTEGLLEVERSLTGDYLAGRKKIAVPQARRPAVKGELVVRGAREHNLKDIDVAFPLACFTCVTGVSGSGKSTLVNDVLYRAVHQKLIRTARLNPGRHKTIEGLDQVDKVIDIDQSPIGRTPRSNAATYTGVFDHVRKLFAKTQDAKRKGYEPGRFSFNVRGGRCEACTGDGTIKIEMHFLPDVYVPCEVCKGKRYNRETLEVRFKGKNISEVLDMSVTEACEFFEAIPPIARHLNTLRDVGLGYIKLGQPAPTLSGGEAQRVKLSTELSKRSTGKTLYILDEPTTGLHFDDVAKLLGVLHRLVESGNTVVVIEHNLDVIKTADHVIDLGPGGGAGGGKVVALGTPEEVAATPGSFTGEFLQPLLGAASAPRRAPRKKPAARTAAAAKTRTKVTQPRARPRAR